MALDAHTQHLFVATIGVDPHGLIPVTGGGGSVRMLDARTGRELRRVPVGHEPFPFVLDASRAHIFVMSRIDRTLTMLDTQSGQVLRTVTLDMAPDALAIDRSAGRVILVASGNGGGSAGQVSTFNAATGRRVHAARVNGNVWAVAVDERRGRAYVPGTAATYVIDTQSGAVVRAIAQPGGHRWR